MYPVTHPSRFVWIGVGPFALGLAVVAAFVSWPNVAGAQYAQLVRQRSVRQEPGASPFAAQYVAQQPVQDAAQQPGQGAGAVAAPAPELVPCEDSQIVARVGGEVVLASEVIALAVRDFLDKNDKPIPREERSRLIKGRLKYHTELKLIYLDAKRTIPEEAMPRIKTNLGEFFEEKEIKAMMKAAKVESRQELDDKLRIMGTSIQRQKQIFIERALAMQWMQQEVEEGEPITHERMLEYYNDQLADYEHPARARWEELAVKVASASSKEEAYAHIVRMGNLVQDGASFSEVAKNGSDGITAGKGGARDWTTKGSLVSDVLDRAAFSLPVGELSPILESDRGFHIMRVIQRQDAHRTPFVEAQGEIRKTIKRQQDTQSRKAYLAKLAKYTKVWTIFDEPDKQQLHADRRSSSGERDRYPR